MFELKHSRHGLIIILTLNALYILFLVNRKKELNFLVLKVERYYYIYLYIILNVHIRKNIIIIY